MKSNLTEKQQYFFKHNREYYAKHREEIIARKLMLRKTEAGRNAYNEYQRRARKNNPKKSVDKNAVSMIRSMIIGRATYYKFFEFDHIELRLRLEETFKEGMFWSNYGRYLVGKPRTWCVDHIIPVRCFSYESAEDEQFEKCWSLLNLRSRWSDENCRDNRSLQ